MTYEGQIGRRLKLAEAFNMDIVLRRYCKEHDIPIDVAKEHERELKRYLVLCASTKAALGMHGPLDELWHTFILFTREYAAFCQAIDASFIHHVPVSETPHRDPNGSVSNSYQLFLETYKDAYHEEAPAHLWPRSPVPDPAKVVCEIGCGGGRCAGPSCVACHGG